MLEIGFIANLRTTEANNVSLGIYCRWGWCDADVKDIKYVINFDYPNNSEDYVHRIGRTGRAGETGTAHTFFTTKDAKQARDLIKVLREAKQKIPSELEQMSSISGGGGGTP